MSKTKSTKVLIIGAGISGLKAAETLLSKSNLTGQDVLVAEAQNRVGGRLKTTDASQSKLGINYDLGASWFHDSLNNSVLNDMISSSLLDVQKDVYFDDKDLKAISSTGEVPLVDKKLNRVLEDIEKFIELYFHDSLNVPDLSLQDIVAKFFEKYNHLVTEEQREHCGRMMRYLELWFGISWDRISGKHAVMDHQGRNLLNKRGYGYLVESLLNCIPKSSILLEEPVNKIIRYNKEGDKRVLVETKSGLQIFCDYLIVTVPQSILSLKESSPYSIKWEPELPQRLVDSINSIHFGALGKVIFEFDKIFWDNSEDRFQIIADHIDGDLSSELTELPKPFTYPLFAVNFGRVHNLGNGKSSLVILTQAPLTNYLEAHPDQAWQYYQPMLQNLSINDEPIPDPINTIVTDWTINPYIRGSYSAMYTNDDPSDLIINLSGEFESCGISEPYIRFAGEHTISEGAGCVHGAYDSGIRAADWILQDMNVEN
ncbi:corticosteroid-binding protein, putative [Candida dubliniensis CD36]|uniref:Corticosteroid-binding protein, putative n=1 Tax=Candida dubliniensis (strain CD36 / ATCC MYA-646 / CBS 7987 / NCPF 3949 / NRRL Y-17841) TaxID=573826 RepID=B9WMU1_CANDC|nr:corticosteroid-binding protein, putative [Candida dubliniensis CD36]CAX40407.1 corticosteroid-binding protein, putative [Candida dubliniensis CD36]